MQLRPRVVSRKMGIGTGNYQKEREVERVELVPAVLDLFE
jgi:hypothetical protein